MFLTICADNSPFTGELPAQRPVTWVWINGCANNGEASDLRRHRTHYDVLVCITGFPQPGVQQRADISQDCVRWCCLSMKFSRQMMACGWPLIAKHRCASTGVRRTKGLRRLLRRLKTRVMSPWWYWIRVSYGCIPVKLLWYWIIYKKM